MKNLWNDVKLEIYEAHMSLADVAQLQMLNQIMKEQLQAYPEAESIAVIGVAGGNGLEHCGKRFKRVYGIDVNPEYLKVCAQRFQQVMGERLRLIESDISEPGSILPKVDLLVANLLIEYVGIKLFCAKSAASQAVNVSCVIQGIKSEQSFVSESPYQAKLQGISELHRDVDEMEFIAEMNQCGYCLAYRETYVLPNGKQFIRLDFKR